MKRDHWTVPVMGLLLSAMTAWGCMGCLVTGFSLGSQTVMWKLLPFVLGVPAAMLLCGRGKLRWLPLGIAVLAGVLLWFFGDLEASLEAVLYRISGQFDRIYDVGTIRWTEGSPMAVSADTALCALGVLAALLMGGCLFRGYPVSLGVTGGAAVLLLSVMTLGTEPERLWLLLLLAGLALMVFTEPSRQSYKDSWGKLALLLTLPVLLAGGLLLWWSPPEEYREETWLSDAADRAIRWASEIQEEGVRGILSITGSAGEDRVELTRVGKLNPSRVTVMELTGTAQGVLYLRGQSLDTYNGRSWTSSGQESGLHWPASTALTGEDTLTVETRQVLPQIYVPYYAVGMEPDPQGFGLENGDGRRVYSYTLRSISGSAGPVSPERENICLELPASTRAWAEEVVWGILPEGDRDPVAMAAAIGKYVSRSGKYSLRPEKMPLLETDFARWFLTEQDTGYCVHFATAAVVLLRAAGIPARYTTGYMVNKTGQTVTVRADQAHAWAEYWAEGLGWMILEATPSDDRAPTVTGQPSPETAPAVTGTAPAAATTTVPSSAAATTAPAQGSTRPQQTPETTEPGPETELPGAPAGSWLTGLLLAAAALILVWAQRRLRLKLRRQRLRRGDTNRRAVKLWREAVRLHRLLGKRLPNQLHRIPEKARFSPYTLTEEELVPLESSLREAVKALSEDKWYRRLVWQYLLAVC